ncbi:MAG: alpha/beta fold hydrolase [Luminiphilus sp.]|nr:alpha/beta fold hydrolase [Luminiphilus sp.]MBL6820734.1 alpha/beta fold hydrolase [Luminiphilus sp.]
MTTPRPLNVRVDGLNYAGLEWGDPEGYPILCLHGWLDNALSFSVMAPYLNRYRLIALDLSGQGLSDHRSPDGTYHIWDDIPQLLAVIESMDLPSLAVLGHSRGAAIAVLLATALQARCSHLILLDGMLPSPVSSESAVEQFLQAQKDRQSLDARPPRLFPDIEAFVSARQRLGFSAQSARILARRALREVQGGWVLTHDPRLNHASAVKLSREMCAAFYEALTINTLALVADEGLRKRGGLSASLEAVKDIAGCTVEAVPGSHHTHMEEGASYVADRVAAFVG